MDITPQALAQWRDEENEKLVSMQAFINGQGTVYTELSADQQMGLNRILSTTTDLSNQLDLLLAKWGPVEHLKVEMRKLNWCYVPGILVFIPILSICAIWQWLENRENRKMGLRFQLHIAHNILLDIFEQDIV